MPRDPQYHPVLILWPNNNISPTCAEIDYAEGTLTPPRSSSTCTTPAAARTSRPGRARRSTPPNGTTMRSSGPPPGSPDTSTGSMWFADTNPAHQPTVGMHQTVQLDWFPDGTPPNPARCRSTGSAFTSERCAYSPEANSGRTGRQPPTSLRRARPTPLTPQRCSMQGPFRVSGMRSNLLAKQLPGPAVFRSGVVEDGVNDSGWPDAGFRRQMRHVPHRIPGSRDPVLRGVLEWTRAPPTWLFLWSSFRLSPEPACRLPPIPGMVPGSKDGPP